DDALGAGDARALDHREADAAATEHGDARARLHPGGVEHRADAGGDAAADERRALERNLGIDLDQVLGGDGGVLRHGAAAGKDAERRAAAVVHARRALERRGKRLALLEAQHRSPGDAEAALAAHIDEGKDDVVAFGKIADAL